MTMDIKQAVTDRFEQYRKKPTSNYGFIGILTTGAIAVPGKANTIYVTLVTGKIIEVINNRVPNILQQPVMIGRDDMLPKLDQVLSVWDVYGGRGSTTQALASAANIPYATMTWPGINTVFIAAEQILPGLVFPAGGLNVTIFPGAYLTGSGWKIFKQTTILDLASHLPSATGNARYVLIVVDSSGAYAVRDGSDVSGYASLADANIPAPSTGDIRLYAIKLFQGQTELKKEPNVNDFTDLRFLVASGGSTNAPTISMLGILIHDADTKTIPVDADELPVIDSETSNILKKITWASIKAVLNSFYAAISHNHSGSEIASGTLDGDRLPALSTTKKGGVPATGTPSGKYLKDNGSWDTPSGGGGGSGRTLISETYPAGASSASFSSIPSTFKKITIEWSAKATAYGTGIPMTMQFNGDTTAGNYLSHNMFFYGGSAGVQAGATAYEICSGINSANDPAGEFTIGTMTILSYFDTSFFKKVLHSFTLNRYDVGFLTFSQVESWMSTAAITDILISLTSGDFETNSVFRLYGEN